MKVEVYECTQSTMIAVPQGTSLNKIEEYLKNHLGLSLKPNGIRFPKDLHPQVDPTLKSPFGITPDEAISQIHLKGYALSSGEQKFTESMVQP